MGNNNDDIKAFGWDAITSECDGVRYGKY